MLMKTVHYIIPYNDLVNLFYISFCNRFTNPRCPTVSMVGYSEIEYLVKECCNGILYEIAGNPTYSANLDETLFIAMRDKLKHLIMLNGFGSYHRHILWWDNFIEEIIFPKIIERTNCLRELGFQAQRIDWSFDQDCILVKV